MVKRHVSYLPVLLCIFSFLSLSAQQPEVVVQTGHSSQIFKLQYSADGSLLLSGSSDNTVNVWDVSTGMAIRSFQGHEAVITAATFNESGKWVAIAGVDEGRSSIRIFDLDADEPVRDLVLMEEEDEKKVPVGIQDMNFSPDGSLLVTKSRKALKIWNTQSGELLQDIKITTPPINIGKNYSNVAVTFCGNGQKIRTEFRPGKLSGPAIGEWDVATGKLLKTMALEAKKSLKIPNLSVKNPLKNPLKVPKIGKKGPAPLTWYVMSPDGNRLCYVHGGALNITLEIWDLELGRKIRNIEPGKSFGKIIDKLMTKAASGERARFSMPLTFSADNSHFAMAVAGKVKVFSLASGKIEQTLHYALIGKLIRDKLDKSENKTGLNFEGYSSLAFHPDGKFLSGGGGNLSGLKSGEEKKAVQMINIWNVFSGLEVMRLEGQYNRVNALAFVSGTGKLISAGNRLHFWDLHTGRADIRTVGKGGPLQSIGVSGNGKVLAQGKKNALEIVDLEQGKLIKKISAGGHAELHSPALDEKGKRLAYRHELYDLESGNKIPLGQDGRSKSYFSTPFFAESDSRLLDGGNAFVLYNTENGESLHNEKSAKGVYIPAYGPAGQALYVLANEDNMAMMNAASGKELVQFDLSSLKGLPKGIGKETQLRLSPGFSYLATGKSEKGRNISVWNTKTGQLTGTLSGHSRNISDIAFDHHQSLIATAASNSEIRLWKLPSCERVATIVPVDTSDFIISTPDHYYLATKGALGKVAFRIGHKAFPFEQFDLQFNRPDIVLQRIGIASPTLIAAYKKAHQKRLQRMGFTEDMFGEDLHLPTIRINGNSPPQSISSSSLSFAVTASDEKYTLDRLQVYVNDVPVYGMNGMDLRDQNTKAWNGNVDLELSAGMNKVQVSCMNAHGVESLKSTFYTNCEAQAGKPDLYLITLGVSEYKDARFNLNYAAKDAKDLQDLLSKKAELYGTIHSRHLIDKDVTAENVAALKSFLASSKTNDQVIIFIAGHGLLDADFNYYFGTYNIDFDAPSKGGLPYEALEALIDGIKPRKKLLIMDTCHSGEVDSESVEVGEKEVIELGAVTFRSAGAGIRKKHFGLENSFELMKFLFADLRRGTGATVISSAGGAEYALEGEEWKNGVFTYAMLSGMQELKADLNGDGEVMLSELQVYVRAQVQDLTGGKQVPTSRLENMTVDFRVW